MQFHHFDSFVIEVWSMGCDWSDVAIGLDNDLAWTGDKPLSKAMMTQFNNAYMQY